MYKLTFAAFLLIALSFTVFAECYTSTYPKLRQITFGMTPQDVSDKLRLKEPLEPDFLTVKYKDKEYIVDAETAVAIKPQNSIKSASFNFYNNRTYKVSFTYELESVKNIKEFTDYISESFNLPKREWSNHFKQFSQIECVGFSVSIYLTPSIAIISLLHTDTKTRLLDQAKELAEKQEKPFNKINL